MSSLGVTSFSTTAYHPQCNGLVERMHRQLKGAIRARLSGTNWRACLPLVLLGLRSAWRAGPEAAPAQLLYGSMLRLPGEFTPGPEVLSTTPNTSFVSSFQSLMRTQKPAPLLHHPSSLQTFVPRNLRESSMVLVRQHGVRRPLQPPYNGPFPVLESGDKVFKILRNGFPYTVSVDRLKPCNLPLTPPFSSIIPNRRPPPPHSSDPSPVAGPSSIIHDSAPPLQSPRTDASTPVCPRTDVNTPDFPPAVPAPNPRLRPRSPLSTDQDLPPAGPAPNPRLRPRSPLPANPPLPSVTSSSTPVPLPSAAPPQIHNQSGSSSLDLQSRTDFPPLDPPRFTMSGRQSKPRIRLNL